MDYYIYFKNFEEQVSTSDLKIVLNQQLEDPLGQPRLGRFRIDPNYTDFIGKHILFFLCKVGRQNKIFNDFFDENYVYLNAVYVEFLNNALYYRI